MLARPDYAPLRQPTAPPPGVEPETHAVASLAAANGWEYFTHATEQPLPGIVFRGVGGQPRLMQLSTNIVRVPAAAPIEIGNSFYLENAAGNQFPQHWGYAAVQTGRLLPAVVIEVERNRKRSPLPSLPDADIDATILGAPGREVSLHTTAAASSWASTVFTPDIVELLDAGTVAFDLELAGGYVFLYAPGKLATPEPAVWERVLSTISAVVERIQSVATPDPASTSGAQQVGSSPMRSRGWAVNGKRYLWQWGALAAGMLAAGLFAAFAPR